MCVGGPCATREAPGGGWRSGAGQRLCREARSRPLGVADGVVVPMRPGNAGGGKDPWSGNGAGRSERQAIDASRLGRRQGSKSSPRHHMRKRRRESSIYRPTGGSAGAESAAVSKLAALWTANGPTSGCAGGARWAARGLTATPTMSARQSVAPRAPVCADARPSVGEGMIPERAGCGKSARPVRRAATGNGVGINRVVPARHRASRRLHPGRLSASKSSWVSRS